MVTHDLKTLTDGLETVLRYAVLVKVTCLQGISWWTRTSM